MRDSRLVRWLFGSLLLLRCTSGLAQVPAYAFTNFAGNPPGWVDATGSAARFSSPTAVAVDSLGNIYVADENNHVIRKVTPAGVVSTLAGKAGEAGLIDGVSAVARFNRPSGVAVDGAGNVFVADTHNGAIRRITPQGNTTTIASGPPDQPSFEDAPAGNAGFALPTGVAVDAAGNVYVADQYNSAIRKVTPQGRVVLVAGNLQAQGMLDGTGATALFYWPQGITIDGSGNLLVADTGNNAIRKVTPAGTVTTVAGQGRSHPGFINGPAASARFSQPRGIAVDGAGNVYVADLNISVIRVISAAGEVSVLAGDPASPGDTDGSGAAARFYGVTGLAWDGTGSVIIAEGGNHTIRRTTPAGLVTTLAGASSREHRDGTGNLARFSSPVDVALDGAGNLYVPDPINGVVRKVRADGMVTTVVAGVSGPTGIARFGYPTGVAVATNGTLYVADGYENLIYRITATGVLSLLAGNGKNQYYLTDGQGTEASFTYPQGIALDQAGNLYVADTFNNAIRRVTPGGLVSTLAGNRSAGYADGAGSAAQFSSPSGVAVAIDGTVYVADQNNARIRKITPDGMVTTLAGFANTGGFFTAFRAVPAADGAGSIAGFYFPNRLAVDTAGNVFVTDLGNQLIRKITPEGFVTTVAGAFGREGSADGAGAEARFTLPFGIAVAADGTLYVSDNGNRITKGVQTTVPAPAITVIMSPMSPAVLSTVYYATASATVTSPAPIGYQWLKDGTPIPEATNSALPSVTFSNRANGGSFSLVVSNAYGMMTNSAGSVRVQVPQQLQASPMQNGGIRLLSGDRDGGSITSDALNYFIIEATTNVLSTNWVRYTNGFSIVGGMVQFDDPDAPNSPRRFYRVIER